jgi:aryl-alcohol dehydrogenase-like predicted oxidoreductase
MIYRTLGKTGFRVSAIGMGCSGIGKSLYNNSEEESLKTLCAAFESGINFFDAAPNYNNGDSEKLIASALKNNREKIIIASKVGVTFTQIGKFAKRIKPFLNPIKDIFAPVKKNLPNLYHSQRRNNFSKKFILKTVESSLDRLQTDYLDLLLLHHPTNHILETGDFCESFELLKSQGKIRFYGVSCDSVEQAILSLKLTGISFIQIDLNLLDKKPIKEVLPLAVKNNIGVVARLPLAKGLLTDNISDTKAESWAYNREIFLERKRRAEKLKFLIKDNRSIVQTAIQFLLQLKGAPVTLPGFSNRKHLNEILNTISAHPLDQQELDKIYSV